MRTRAKQKSVAKATALGTRVPRAELLVLRAQKNHKEQPGNIGFSIPAVFPGCSFS